MPSIALIVRRMSSVGGMTGGVIINGWSSLFAR
jgi:hypothetical protein